MGRNSRNTDPQTSHEAERALIAKSQRQKIMSLMKDRQGRTLDEAYPEMWRRWYDLRRDGYLVVSAEAPRPGRTGRKQRVFEVSEKGMDFYG